MRVVLAVHDPPIWRLPAREADRIRASLPDLDVVVAGNALERRREFPRADVLVATWIREDETELLGRVRWIHSTAVGVDSLVRPGIAERGILVTNSRGVHAETIAEHALALVLALRRGLHVARSRQIERVWAHEELAAREVAPLSGACLVVVGLGAIGSRVAAFGRALGMRVVGVRRRTDLPPPPGVHVVLPASRLHDALAEADAVVLAAPETPGTRALIDAAALAAMRPTAILVNVARGALVDETALVRALEAGTIAGAGLDAFIGEPLEADSPFWRLPNVLVTPHSASFQGDYWGPVVDLFLDNMSRFRRGEPPRNVVDPERGY
jgi:phosphoglycerate dehydrogenase-like enzyme